MAKEGNPLCPGITCVPSSVGKGRGGHAVKKMAPSFDGAAGVVRSAHSVFLKPFGILAEIRISELASYRRKKSVWTATTLSRLSRLCRLFRGAGPITAAVNTRRLWLLVLLDSGFVTIREESICIEERACVRCLLEPDCRWIVESLSMEPTDVDKNKGVYSG